MKKPRYTDKQAQERAMAIRRQNLQRHQKAAAMSTLRTEIARHTANRNYQMELDRLHEASLRHNGLDAVGARRMADLQALVR
jgi:hypothetical protein